MLADEPIEFAGQSIQEETTIVLAGHSIDIAGQPIEKKTKNAKMKERRQEVANSALRP